MIGEAAVSDRRGVSMSGIAAILNNWGFTVTGSDTSDSENVQSLIQKGIKVVIGHSLPQFCRLLSLP